MLFRSREITEIAAGRLKVAFRRWKRPTVRPGGTLRTAAGVLAIETVEPIERTDITEAEAVAAGHASREALLRMLDTRRDGGLYRIAFHLAGPDARDALRERDDLDDAQLASIRSKLERMDAAGAEGPWTRRVLELLDAHPAVRAADVAAGLGRERLAFKRDVRKLKNLGLTISLGTGYRLSPRGVAVLARLRDGAGG